MTNPFDMRGPDFLLLYGFLFSAVVLSALLVRWILTRSPGSPSIPLDVYEVAYLAGGPTRVCVLAVTGLITKGLASFSSSRSLVVTAIGAGLPFDRVQSSLTSRSGRRLSRGDIRPLLSNELLLIRQALQTQELVLRDDSLMMSRVITGALFLGLLAFGVAKICVGVSRDRPVGLLVLFCAATFGTGAWLMRSPRLTSGGRQVLRRLRADQPRSPGVIVPKHDRIALLGVRAMSSHPKYRAVREYLGPADGSGGIDFGGSTSCSSAGHSGCGGHGGHGGCGGCGGGHH